MLIFAPESWGALRRGAIRAMAAPGFEREKNRQMTKNWQPHSWRSHEARQLPTYRDADALAAAERQAGFDLAEGFGGLGPDLVLELARPQDGVQVGHRFVNP